jgi:hypothetical protein
VHQISVLYDGRASATPSQSEYAVARRRFHAGIAAKARPDNPVSARACLAGTILIPNTPFGVSKTFLRKPIRVQPELNYRLWCDDLVASVQHLLKPPRQVRAEDIQMVCAVHYGVSKADLLSPVRRADIIVPRHVAIYLCRAMTSLSLPAIGRKFSGRDHTTILHAERKIGMMISADLVFAAEIETIKDAVAARVA